MAARVPDLLAMGSSLKPDKIVVQDNPAAAELDSHIVSPHLRAIAREAELRERCRDVIEVSERILSSLDPEQGGDVSRVLLARFLKRSEDVHRLSADNPSVLTPEAKEALVTAREAAALVYGGRSGGPRSDLADLTFLEFALGELRDSLQTAS